MKTTRKFLAALYVAFLATTAGFAQVKIGDNPSGINPGAVLDIESTNKGLLLPRVSLSSTTTWSLSGTATAGMHVYNTNSSVTSSNPAYPILASKTGEYYWNGMGWVALGGDQSTEVALYVTGNQTSPTTGDVKVNYTSAKYDKNSNFDLSADQITIPSSGYYMLILQGKSGSASSYVNYGSISVNGITVDGWDSGIVTGPSLYSGSSIQILELNTGDILTTHTRNNTNATTVSFQFMVTKLSN